MAHIINLPPSRALRLMSGKHINLLGWLRCFGHIINLPPSLALRLVVGLGPLHGTCHQLYIAFRRLADRYNEMAMDNLFCTHWLFRL